MKDFNTNTTNSDVWLTPPPIIYNLGDFDLDPCSPINRPWGTAKKHYTIEDNGLLLPWFGRVWLNPPYGSQLIHWLKKMAEHMNGTALIYGRTDTIALQDYMFPFAESVLFIKGRIKFHYPNGEQAKTPGNAPSLLIGYSEYDSEMIEQCGIKGYHVYLRDVFYFGLEKDYSTETWRVIVGEAVSTAGTSLREIYSKVEKLAPERIKRNPNHKAKIRQILQYHFKRIKTGYYGKD